MNMPFYLIFYNFHNKTIHYFFINAHGGGMSYFNIINSRFRIRYLYRSIIICADTELFFIENNMRNKSKNII